METLDKPIKSLIKEIPQIGQLEYIVLRPERNSHPVLADSVMVTTEDGLAGDHFKSRVNTKRQVTLIQAEHLQTVASILQKNTIDPLMTRRNLVVKGINLLSLRNQRFRIGDTIFEGTGYCHPCSRMEENLGPGGYNAMRGHGGITARVIENGSISIGDEIQLIA